jgi:hypothetical protein
VNQDVKDAFQVVHKLMIHSYFEYLFIDVAVTKALHVFEMALKLRYKEVNNSEWNKKKTLEQLIEWFRGQDFFETEDKRFFDHVRNTRNYLSHPERHGYAGMASFHWISTAVDIINDLYENVELRKQRRLLTDKFLSELRGFLVVGAKLTFMDKQILVYTHGHVLINNKVSPTKAHFCLFLMPDIAKAEVPMLFNFDTTVFSSNPITIILSTASGHELLLTKTLNDSEVSRIAVFRKQRATHIEEVIKHNALLFQSHEFILGTWRYIRHI